MVDIHCHVLPSVDDGAKDWDIALGMCALAAQDGTTHLVATPHANDTYNYDRASHAAVLDELQRRIGNKVQLSLGCDFHFSFDNIEKALVHPHTYTIAGGTYLLVEFSDYALSPATLKALDQFLRIGITPVITHPERNLILQRHPEMVLQMAEMGCAIQITASSFVGFWGDRSKKMSWKLLERGAVHVIASDAHDTKYRTPTLSAARAAIAKEAGEEVATALAVDNPSAALRSQPMPFFPAPAEKY
jgi:protein-tyrosine phosphatase